MAWPLLLHDILYSFPYFIALYFCDEGYSRKKLASRSRFFLKFPVAFKKLYLEIISNL